MKKIECAIIKKENMDIFALMGSIYYSIFSSMLCINELGATVKTVGELDTMTQEIRATMWNILTLSYKYSEDKKENLDLNELEKQFLRNVEEFKEIVVKIKEGKLFSDDG